jgi:hypothetical protein
MTKKIRKARVKKRRKSFWPAVKDLGWAIWFSKGKFGGESRKTFHNGPLEMLKEMRIAIRCPTGASYYQATRIWGPISRLWFRRIGKRLRSIN